MEGLNKMLQRQSNQTQTKTILKPFEATLKLINIFLKNWKIILNDFLKLVLSYNDALYSALYLEIN